MITNEQYELLRLELVAKLELIKEQKKEAQGWEMVLKFDSLEEEYRELLAELHYKYHSQFAKPVPSKPYIK
ncbi:hypothetical protein KLF50_14690 (plasmid) [Clostridium perfringens]|uniref:hypothetical protein n=1 Tax=Clostridium perfringens TaxID=1502 RepID=UPI001CCD7687|nr:hypothetical protein [Clostridium perfringens]UBK83411.1 hypothetical protein KLF50_14690 [Clostridium perfringens]